MTEHIENLHIAAKKLDALGWHDRAAEARAAADAMEQLQSEHAELSRGGVHWWHKMREVAAMLGLTKLTEVPVAVAQLQAANAALQKQASQFEQLATAHLRRITELENDRDTLAADLQGHKDAVAELRHDLEEVTKERDYLRQRLAEELARQIAGGL